MKQIFVGRISVFYAMTPVTFLPPPSPPSATLAACLASRSLPDTSLPKSGNGGFREAAWNYGCHFAEHGSSCESIPALGAACRPRARQTPAPAVRAVLQREASVSWHVSPTAVCSLARHRVRQPVDSPPRTHSTLSTTRSFSRLWSGWGSKTRKPIF